MADLQAVVDLAATELPEGYVVTIYVENGAAWIDLTDPEGDVVPVETDDMNLDEQIARAVDAARRDEVAHG